MTYDDAMDWLKDKADDAAWDHENRLRMEKEYWENLDLIDDLMSVVQDYAETWYWEEKYIAGEIVPMPQGRKMKLYKLVPVEEDEKGGE